MGVRWRAAFIFGFLSGFFALRDARAQGMDNAGGDVFEGGGDWGVAWIDHVLRGMPLPDALARHFTQMDAMAAGLRQVLSIYSYAMLVLAGVLLIYYVTMFVVETAQSGVPFGKRMSPVWAPIRLVVAMGLLVPASGGLNSGQYIVIKLAEEGSHMASHAWRSVMESANDEFGGLVMPHAPPLGGLVSMAAEMEMCRLVYEQLYAPLQADTVLRVAGHINDAVKIPANRLSGEVWRYSNLLNSNSPLCGEYRFSGYRPHGFLNAAETDATAQLAAALGAFSEQQTNVIIEAGKSIALQAAPEAMTGAFSSGDDGHNAVTASVTGLQKDYDNQLSRLLSTQVRVQTPGMAESVEGGWIAAAFFIPDMVRVQQSYGELVAGALPEEQEPVFDHPALTQQLLAETVKTQLWPLGIESAETVKLAGFYSHVSRVISGAHSWLYGTQLVENGFAPASSFDLLDQMNAGTTPDAALGLFAHALDSAAVAQGVWGVAGDSGDRGYPFARLSSAPGYNPLAMLSEFGRRQFQLGLYLMGLAGQAITLPNAVAPAVFAGLGGGCFILGAGLLIFVLPFLVFFRFIMAVVAWMLSLLEAVAAMPIVALAHLTPTGEGLSGSMARQAYLLWLALWARPVLTLMGFVGGFVLFTFALAFLSLALTPFAQLSYTGNSGILITSNVALVLVFDVLVYALANASFKGISLFPDRALNWVSRFVMSDGGASATAFAGGPALPQSGGGTTHVTVNAPAAAHFVTGQSMGQQAAMMPAYREKPAAVLPTKTESANLQKALFPVMTETQRNASVTAQRDEPFIVPSLGVKQEAKAENNRQPADRQRDNGLMKEIKPEEMKKKPEDLETEEERAKREALSEDNRGEDKGGE